MRRKNFIISVILWLFYFFITVAFSASYTGISKALHFTVILISFQMLLVYTNLFLLIPQWLEKKQISLYVAFSLLTIIILVFLRFQLPTVHDENSSRFSGLRLRIVFFTFNILLAYVFSTVWYFIADWFKNMQLRSELKYQKAEIELKYLKSSINPHFLFNTLNNIYTLCYLKDDKAAPAVLKLSEMMRYILHDGNRPLIELEKEILFIKNFIALQNLKKERSMQVTFEVEGVKGIHKIAPLLLITFVENCYKHGNIESSNSGWIRINLIVDEQNTLIFFIANSKKTLLVNDGTQSGLGLENVKRRLSILYGENHSLDIKNEQNQYSLCLKLNLDGIKEELL